MVIVESKDELKLFQDKYQEQDSIVIPILSDMYKHPMDNSLSLIYIQFMDGEEFILPINHSESLYSFDSELISNTKKYTYDKKLLQQICDIDNVSDVNLLHYMRTNQPLDIESIDTDAHRFFNMMHYKKHNINRVIPILKHLDYSRQLTVLLRETLENRRDSDDNFKYNDEITDNLSHIEQNGLQTVDKMVYSQYNIFTSTGRPSNRFSGINFAALNKKDGSRKQFVSRFENGMLVEMDFDAYHLRLIADRVNYDFGKGSVHEHMAKLYNVDYEEAKRLSFQYLYGFLPQEVIQMNAYFSRVHDYINEIWSQFELNDFIESDIYNRRMYKRNLENDITANKLFNYTIQQMETENNMKVLTELIPNIKEYKSKLILYSYDSFLFDFNLDDGLDYLKKVKVILEQDGKYPVKVSRGINYHEMEDITEKFI